MPSFADVYAFVGGMALLIALVSGAKYGGKAENVIPKKIFNVSGALFVVLLAADVAFDIIPHTQESEQITEQPAPKVEQPAAPVAKQPTTPIAGRGLVGRSEPQYVGVSGFVAVWIDQDAALMKEQNYTDTPWQVPTYSTDGQKWYPNSETVSHKEPVAVLEQTLTYDGHSSYNGYLKVKRLADNAEFFINVRNFVTEPYWVKPNIFDAINGGRVIVTYHQRSKYPPVMVNNSKVTLNDGVNLLAIGRTGTYSKGKVDRDTHQVEVGVTPNVSIFFNAADLTVTY